MESTPHNAIRINGATLSGGVEAQANARRIVACVNAFEGVDTDGIAELPDGKVSGLLTLAAKGLVVTRELRKERDALSASLSRVREERERLKQLLVQAISRIEGSLESPGNLEAEWSISDRKFCQEAHVALASTANK
jgi:hypothetical protein